MAATKTPTKAPAKKSTKPAGDRASNALAVKRQLRRTRPRFTRHRPDRKASLPENWRKPRGLHNKLKDRKRGCAPWLSDGYRTPESVRGKHISGLAIAHVANLAQLAGLDPKETGVVIAAVGAKRQLELLHACQQAGLRVLNHKADKRISELQGRFTKKRQDRDAARDAVKQKAAAAEAKAKGKKAVDEVVSTDEKKEEQDKIKEEVLTSKGQ